MAKIPKAPSAGEELFVTQLNAYKITFEREVLFAAPRKWRADFMLTHPAAKILIEIDGGTEFGKSSHSKGKSYESDCRKANTANLLGYTCLKFTSKMIQSGEAIDLIREIFA